MFLNPICISMLLGAVFELTGISLVFISILKLLNTDVDIIRVTLCATAMPLGLNTVVFQAAYGRDTTPGTSMALISHVLSVITIPLMFSLVL